MIEFLKEFLKTNDLASGGLMVMVFGAITGIFYKIYPRVVGFFKRRFIVTLEITSQDETFEWFNKWLASLDYSKKTRLLTVYSVNRHTNRVAGEKQNRPKLFFVPAPGQHIFFYRGRLVLIDRNREKFNDSGIFALYEQFTITMVGRNRELLKEMIAEARDYCLDLEKDDIKIYSNNSYADWVKVTSQKPRDIKTVILKNNLQYEILNDIKSFLSKENWYNNIGIPYRRGYLLYGTPGTGKTSIIKALAGELDACIYILNIHKELKEGDFNRLMTNIPTNSILLIEDIDRLFKSKGKLDETYKISFKTILNAIDGVISPYGSLIFMTTNNKDRLDKALIRPGRIDRQYFIDKVDKNQAKDLFKLFYPRSNGAATTFAEQIPENKYTPADLQRYFITNRTKKEALNNMKQLKNEYKL